MQLALIENSESDNHLIPFYLRIEVAALSPDLQTPFFIPIRYQHFRDRSIYRVEICGIPLEARTAADLVPRIEKIIPSLLRGARLPSYIFIARHSRRIYPVYTFGSEVIAAITGGPLFRHIELAKVREYLADYLYQTGELWPPPTHDRLHVRGVDRLTLGLIRPVFYLKKRAQFATDNEFWAPVFPEVDGSGLYTYAASAKRAAPNNQGQEVLQLRSMVAQALIADHRLSQGDDLRTDRLMPDLWLQLRTHLIDCSAQFSSPRLELKLYQADQTLIAMEYRRDEDRYSLYFGRDVEDLRFRAATDLLRRGLIPHPEALNCQETTVEPAPMPS
ncbi:MAG: hypothetical protein H6632_12560 [Anaerolineales bacterium]|nr:hypothetical protein [Anaerolineales bacterium]